jgi:hypothetical protein
MATSAVTAEPPKGGTSPPNTLKAAWGKPPIILGHTDIRQMSDEVAVKAKSGNVTSYRRVAWEPWKNKLDRVCTYFTPGGAEPSQYPHVTVECRPDGSLVSLHYSAEKDHSIWYAVNSDYPTLYPNKQFTVSNQLKAKPEALKRALQDFIDFLQQSGVILNTAVPPISNYP